MIASTSPFSHNATLVAELVVFALVAVVVAKVVAPALRRAMVERQRVIDEGLATAAKATERLAHADTEYRRIVEDARRDGAETLDMYRKMAATTEADARRRSRAHHRRTIERTRREVDARLRVVDEAEAARR